MAISVDHLTRVIFVPQADLTLIQGDIYELNVNQFRLWLKDWEDSVDGMNMPDTHRHNTEVTLGGVTLARTVEIINGYTITFEDGQYAINLTGANNNLGDVTNVNQVSIRSSNSAGLTSQATAEEIAEAVFNNAVESGFDLTETLRLILATLAGKVSGAGTSTITFRDVNDTKNRVISNVDSNGNRTSVTLDKS